MMVLSKAYGRYMGGRTRLQVKTDAGYIMEVTLTDNDMQSFENDDELMRHLQTEADNYDALYSRHDEDYCEHGIERFEFCGLCGDAG